MQSFISCLPLWRRWSRLDIFQQVGRSSRQPADQRQNEKNNREPCYRLLGRLKTNASLTSQWWRPEDSPEQAKPQRNNRDIDSFLIRSLASRKRRRPGSPQWFDERISQCDLISTNTLTLMHQYLHCAQSGCNWQVQKKNIHKGLCQRNPPFAIGSTALGYSYRTSHWKELRISFKSLEIFNVFEKKNI